jgi:hypothetical protein
MKTFTPIVTIAAALSLCGGTALRGQASIGAGSAPPQVQEAMDKAQAEAQRAQAEAQQQFQKAQQEFQDVGRQMEEQMAQVQRQVAQGGASAGGGALAGAAGPVYGTRLQSIIARASGNSGTTLVIRSSNVDPKEQANLEEDLAVMSHIFDKAIAGKPGDGPHPRTAMGIDVFFTSSPSPLHSLYLDGYGALFMLNVDFPLLASPTKPDAPKEKSQADSTWQEAQRELYGQPAGADPSRSIAEEYSEDKVNDLKNALLEALKDATNIRNLKSDDSITVCVFGGANGAPARMKVQGPFGGYSNSAGGSPMRRTIMTIRAKKSDVDAFAKGKLNLDEFRKKAGIAIYSGDAGNPGGGGSYSAGGGGVFPEP